MRRADGAYDPQVYRRELLRISEAVVELQERLRVTLKIQGREDRQFARALESHHRTLNQVTRLVSALSLSLPAPSPPEEKPPVKSARKEKEKTADKSKSSKSSKSSESLSDTESYPDYFYAAPSETVATFGEDEA